LSSPGIAWRGYQAGEFKNVYNDGALAHIQIALNLLNSRTRERSTRGVEGYGRK
jgi:hypothetical protein